jgi:hypothetical protein
MKGFYSFLALGALVILAPRSKAQYSPLEVYREEVNLNRKNLSDRNPQKTIEINIADLPESDADKNRIQKGYDNLVAAVQTKNGEEVNRVLDNLDILTKQKVLHKFIQNFKSLLTESVLEQGKEDEAIKAEERLPEQSDQ